MSNFSFTKLFSSITESTIWAEPDHVRIVWITMLAMSDMRGRVYATIPGLAGRARVTVEQCEEALEKFKQPDKYSRSREHEGRRIEEIDGGWGLLNYDKYRALRDSEKDKERKRNWAAKKRSVDRSRRLESIVDHGGPASTGVDRGRPKTEDRVQSTEEEEGTSTSRVEGEVSGENGRGSTTSPPVASSSRGLGRWAVATYADSWKTIYGANPEVSPRDAGELNTLAKRMVKSCEGDVTAGKALFSDYLSWYLARNGYWATKAHPVSGMATSSTINEYKAGLSQ